MQGRPTSVHVQLYILLKKLDVYSTSTSVQLYLLLVQLYLWQKRRSGVDFSVPACACCPRIQEPVYTSILKYNRQLYGAVCTAVQLYTVRMVLLFIKQNGSVYFSAQFTGTTAVPRTPVSSAQNTICR